MKKEGLFALNEHSEKGERTVPYVLVRHKVADYNTWKQGFDQARDARKGHISREGQILRNVNDPSEHLILFEVTDLEKARQHLQSEETRQSMQRHGVIDEPDIYFLEEIEHLVL